MTIISKSALTHYRSSEMYALVDDIDAYPQFLPWCRSATVISRSADEVRAKIEIAHMGLHKSITTCNRHQKNKMIEMRLLEGPFRHLEGFWRFQEWDGSGCKVSLDMDFEFSSKLIAMVFGPIFSQITSSMVDAFCKRAEKIYGKS